MPKLKVGYDGNRIQAISDFERKYGREPPEWMVDNRHAPWAWDKVAEIAGSMGLFREPGPDPLGQPTPSNHRSEVFENELDYMTPVAAELVTELLGGDCYVTEMPYANNFRTDLAICEIDADALQRRLAVTDGDDRSLAGEWKFMKSYRWFRGQAPVTYDEFVDDGPYSSATTNRRVWNRLEDMGLLAFRGEYAVGVDVPIHITAHAVELKQRDWETAFEQAKRAATPTEFTDHFAPNRNPKKYGYADYCWVVMDAGHIDKALEHREKFENGKVGLIGMDEGGVVKLVEPGKMRPPKRSLDREHLNEKTMQLIDVDDYVDRSALSRQMQIGEVVA